MSFLKYFMVLSLIVWLGGLIFFAFVVAPAAFAVLPTRHLAGNVVSRTLGTLHWMGLVSGIVFLSSSLVYSRLTAGSFHPFAARNVLLVLMLALTAVSQFGIMPRMAALRSSMGEIDSVSMTDPARMQFDALHVWSTRVEGGVLLMGFVAVYLTVRSLAD